MNASTIEAARELCDQLDNLIEIAKRDRAPVRAVLSIERARTNLLAHLEEIEQRSSPAVR